MKRRSARVGSYDEEKELAGEVLKQVLPRVCLSGLSRAPRDTLTDEFYYDELEDIVEGKIRALRTDEYRRT